MRFLLRFSALLLAFFAVTAAAQLTHLQVVALPSGRSVPLSLPGTLRANVAIAGLPRVRFLARSPDGRIFATTMFNLADNERGSIVVLNGWDAHARTFAAAAPYAEHLRNPNNLVFWTDPSTHQSWLYVGLTDRLVRFRYSAGDTHPQAAPETLLRFPDYGLNYKYGGWHLTRTVAVGTLHGRTQVYVSAGSSCNYCRELEAERASVIAMNPDGTGARIVAHGMRNAVDLRFVPELDGGALFASNMGDDHLGDKLPEDTFFELDSNAHAGPIAAVAPCAAGERTCVSTNAPNYGWPTCYFAGGKPVHDTTPLPTNPGPGDHEVAERPATHSAARAGTDSVYKLYGGSAAATAGTAAAGRNLAAQAHNDADLPQLGPVPAPLTNCEHVPAAYTTFAAHSSPLGLAYFAPADNTQLAGSLLVALHGAGHTRIGTGYRVVRLTPGDRTPRDFITGFLTHGAAGKPVVHGRPCGMLRIGADSFLLTDDLNGVIYTIAPAGSQ